MPRHGGQGRKAVAMKKMENENHLRVTFSKRWEGFFKKLSEIAVLCDVEVASIILSPENKPYSLGHPSLATTSNKYLTNVPNNHVNLMVDSSPNIPIPNIKQMLEDISKKELDDLSREKAKGKELDELIKKSPNSYWLNVDDSDQMTPEQRATMKVKFEEIYNACAIVKQKILFEANHFGGEAATYGTRSVDPETNSALGTNLNVPSDPMVNDGAGPSGTNNQD